MKVNARWEPQTHKIPNEELEKATHTLIGKPVKIDFQGKPIGIVTDATYQDGGINIEAELDSPRTAYFFDDPKLDGVPTNIVFESLSFLTKGYEVQSSNQKVRK